MHKQDNKGFIRLDMSEFQVLYFIFIILLSLSLPLLFTYLYIYFACLCLSVCPFVSNKRQTGGTDRAQIFCGPSHDPREGLWNIKVGGGGFYG